MSSFSPELVDQNRLSALQRYEILGTEPEETFDRITRLAASAVTAPISIINFVAEEHEWFKSAVGVVPGRREWTSSLCGYAIRASGPLVVEDTRGDDRVSEPPRLESGGEIRAYAGVPLETPDGYRIGTLCVCDKRPRSFSDEEIARLEDLAQLVIDELELRRERAEQQRQQRQLQREKIHVEQTLQSREELLGSIAENVSDAIYRSTPEKGIVYANQAFVEMFGYDSVEEVRGADPQSFYASRQTRDRLFQQAGEQGRLNGVEVEFRRRDGSIFVGRLQSRRIEVDDGATTYYDGVISDVTGEKRQRKQLRQAETLFENAQDALFLIDVQDGEDRAGRQFVAQRVNPAYEEATGLSEEVLRGKTPVEAVGPDAGGAMEEKYRECFRRAEPLEYEEVLVLDGETTYWETRLAPVILDGHVEKLVGATRNVTERRRREERLRSQRQKIESLYTATKRLLTAGRPDVVFDRIHEVLEDVFDYDLNNTGVVTDGKIVPEKTVSETRGRMPTPKPRAVQGGSVSARAHRSGETVVVNDVQILDNDIDYGDLRSVAAVPAGDQGIIVVGQLDDRHFEDFDLRLIEILGAYAALVLDRLDREAALREAKTEAEQASDAKSTFLANMSHEIRTPLTSVIGFAEAIGEETEALEAQLDALRSTPSDPRDNAQTIEQGIETLHQFSGLIEQCGRSLLETLDGVLNLSKLEAGEMGLGAGPVKLSEAATQIVRELRPRAERKDVRLIAEMDESVQATADPQGVKIVLRNLVTNAIKYSEKDERIWVRVRSTAGRPEMEVEDHGIGMEPETVEHLFKPFRQASEGHSREFEGTGLGLAVTRQALQKMGGDIEVETEKGEGSRFIVRLPRTAEEAE